MALTTTGNQLNYDTWQKKKKKKRRERKNIYKYIYIYIYIFFFPHNGLFPWTTPMDKGTTGGVTSIASRP